MNCLYKVLFLASVLFCVICLGNSSFAGQTINAGGAANHTGLNPHPSSTTIFVPPESYACSDKFPRCGKYSGNPSVVLTWPGGIEIRQLIVRNLDHNISLPLPGFSASTSFTSTVDLQISTDGGAHWSFVSAPASNSAGLTHDADSATTRHFNAELQYMLVSGGTLPSGWLIRESPTLVSAGQEKVRPFDGGYLISSFFDIFLELSMDGGATWMPAPQAYRVMWTCPDIWDNYFPDQNYPPLAGNFTNHDEWACYFADGIVIRNVEHRLFTQSNAFPTLGNSLTDIFGGTMFFEMSTDGGVSFYAYQAVTADAVHLYHSDDDGTASFFDSEIYGLDISGGTLPSYFRLRESPTKASTGRVCSMDMGGGGGGGGGRYHLSSFFDVFLELSVDYGATWLPAVNGNFMLNLAYHCPTLTLLPSSLVEAEKGTAYSQTLTASGGTPPYTYLLTLGAPPSGVNVSPDGLLSGTPLEDGIFNFMVTATDSHSCTQTQAYSLVVYPPEAFTPSTKYPHVGKFTINQGDFVFWASGFVIRNVVLRDLTHACALPALGYSGTCGFTGTVDLEMSIDGGATWSRRTSPAITSIYLTHSSDNGATEYFDAEMLSMSITSGLPGGMMIRESPSRASLGEERIRPSGGGYEVSSFFDVWLEISADGGASWMPAANSLDWCWGSGDEYTFIDSKYPPPAGKFSNADTVACRSANGVVIRNFVHDLFSQSFVLPALGITRSDAYSGTVSFDLSTNGGLTYQLVTATASNTVQLHHTDDDGTASFFDSEILQMEISGGTLPAGVQVRESPTKASTGRLTARPEGGGPGSGAGRLCSFFDVFFEISTDYGGTWNPAIHGCFTLSLNYTCPTIALLPGQLPDGDVTAAYLQTITASGGTSPYTVAVSSGSLPPGVTLGTDGTLSGTPTKAGIYTFTVEARDAVGCAGTREYTMTVYAADYFTASDLYPPIGKYSSPSGDGTGWAPGIYIKDIVIKDVTHVGEPPAPQYSQPFQFGCTIGFQLSTDGGQSWNYAYAPCELEVFLTHAADDGLTRFFDGEIWQMDASGGNLPTGMMLRESPTLSSTGKTRIEGAIESDTISSFFDIFTELSIDGGQNWYPAFNPVLIQWSVPDEHRFGNAHFPPDGWYYCAKDDGITFANGVVLRNIAHHGFMPARALPTSGGSSDDGFSGSIVMEVSTDNGKTFTTISAPTIDSVRINQRDGDLSTASFFDTEMRKWSIGGGTLPTGLIFRESPTRQSTGRLSVRPMGGGYKVCSFFDVWLEASTDGGTIWSPGDSGPLDILAVEGPVAVTTQMADRWNLVSVPVVPDDFTKAALYPTATGPAYGYETGYVVKNTLENGVGYWLKFNGAQPVIIAGEPILLDSIPVTAGWQMIGTISYPVLAANITTDPRDLQLSQIFGFEGHYTWNDTLVPGKGYWVKAGGSGKIILAATMPASAPATRRILLTDAMPPAPPDEAALAAKDVPKEFSCAQNYPNPFNPSTRISYAVPMQCNVLVEVYNILGVKVSTLVNEVKQPGEYSVVWDAKDMPSGVYHFRISAGAFEQARKMVLVR